MPVDPRGLKYTKEVILNHEYFSSVVHAIWLPSISLERGYSNRDGYYWYGRT